MRVQTGHDEIAWKVLRHGHGLDERISRELIRARLFPRCGPPRIGTYEVLGVLGRGGMGVVFEASDPKLGRNVAIKVLRAKDTMAFTLSVEAQDRMKREARAMAKLTHPNLVHIYEVNELEGQIYLVMEKIEGISLLRWKEKTKPSLVQITQVLAQIARGVRAIHQRGWIHRDIKPDNILVDSDNHARVIDFGIARPEHPLERLSLQSYAAASSASVHTQTGSQPGTPIYMAPEQLNGRAADARSDQFSIALTAYELITGQRAFYSQDSQSCCDDLLHRRFKLRSTSQAIHPRLAAAIERALSPDPKLRWPDLNELIAALESRSDRGWKRFSVVATLGLAAGAMWAFSAQTATCDLESETTAIWPNEIQTALQRKIQNAESHTRTSLLRIEASLNEYAKGLHTAQVTACRATHIQKIQSQAALDAQYSCLLDHRRHLLRTAQRLIASNSTELEFAGQLLDQLPPIRNCHDALRLPSNEPAPPPEKKLHAVQTLRAEIQRARLLRESEVTAGARELLVPIEAAVETLAYPPLHAEYMVESGSLLAISGQLEKGEQILRDAIDLAEGLRHDELVADGWLALARLLGPQQSNASERSRWLGRARASLTRLQRDADPRWIDLMRAQAAVDIEEGRYEAAIQTYTEAIDFIRLHEMRDNFRSIGLWEGRANARSLLGDVAGASNDYELALERLDSLWGEWHPKHITLLYNIAVLHIEGTGELDVAERSLNRALEIANKTRGADSIESAHIYLVQSMLYSFRGHFAAAKILATRAYDITSNTLGAAHRESLSALNALATIQFRLGDFGSAHQNFLQVFLTQREQLGAEHPEVAQYESNVGETLLQLGHPHRARAHFLHALATLENHFPPDHISLLYPLKGLGQSWLKVGQCNDALSYFERILATWDHHEAIDPAERADVYWATARCLVTQPEQKARAIQFAIDALHLSETSSAPNLALVSAIRPWIQAHQARTSVRG